MTLLNGRIFIGSGATHGRIAGSELIKRYARGLALSCAKVGSPQIRNLGTIGGNCGNASPAGDSIPALYTLEAKTLLQSPQGEKREVPIEEFFTGPGQTVLKPGELILGFAFDKV